jgi:adenylosuccinate synthase
VLDTFDTVRIAVGYRGPDGKRLDHVPHWMGQFGGVEPVYEDLPGWQASIEGITELDKLPKQARAYLDRIEQLCGASISLVSTGPKREETILVRPLV